MSMPCLSTPCLSWPRWSRLLPRLGLSAAMVLAATLLAHGPAAGQDYFIPGQSRAGASSAAPRISRRAQPAPAPVQVAPPPVAPTEGVETEQQTPQQQQLPPPPDLPPLPKTSAATQSATGASLTPISRHPSVFAPPRQSSK